MLRYLSLDIICSSKLSFPRANCSLLGTDNVRGQISEHIFAPNGGYCLYIPWPGHPTVDFGEISVRKAFPATEMRIKLLRKQQYHLKVYWKGIPLFLEGYMCHSCSLFRRGPFSFFRAVWGLGKGKGKRAEALFLRFTTDGATAEERIIHV